MEDNKSKGESIEFAGKVVVALTLEQNIFKRTGKIVTTTDVAREYGIVDIDGTVPIDLRYEASKFFRATIFMTGKSIPC